VAVVTGAAQGIGRRTAEVLAQAGFAVALVDIQSVDAAASAVEAYARPAMRLVGDVAGEPFVETVASQVIERFGRVDCVVNNAGVSSIVAAEQIELAEWRRVMDVNLLGPFLVSREVGRHMLRQGMGSIVNVASVAGLLGIGRRAAYNASKHGLIGLTRSLAAEWGGRGVRVNAVCPGWVKTPMDEAAMSAGEYEDRDIVGRIPMGRFATENDVAQAILFLADPDRSGFVNGHCLSVDGGWAADGGWEALRLSTRMG